MPPITSHINKASGLSNHEKPSKEQPEMNALGDLTGETDVELTEREILEQEDEALFKKL